MTSLLEAERTIRLMLGLLGEHAHGPSCRNMLVAPIDQPRPALDELERHGWIERVYTLNLARDQLWQVTWAGVRALRLTHLVRFEDMPPLPLPKQISKKRSATT